VINDNRYKIWFNPKNSFILFNFNFKCKTSLSTYIIFFLDSKLSNHDDMVLNKTLSNSGFIMFILWLI